MSDASVKVLLATIGGESPLQPKPPWQQRLEILATVPVEQRGEVVLDALTAVDVILRLLRDQSPSVAMFLDLQSDVLEQALDGSQEPGSGSS